MPIPEQQEAPAPRLGAGAWTEGSPLSFLSVTPIDYCSPLRQQTDLDQPRNVRVRLVRRGDGAGAGVVERELEMERRQRIDAQQRGVLVVLPGLERASAGIPAARPGASVEHRWCDRSGLRVRPQQIEVDSRDPGQVPVDHIVTAQAEAVVASVRDREGQWMCWIECQRNR